MGATDFFIEYPSMPREELITRYEQDQQEDATAHGNQYSGSIGSLAPGLDVSDLEFDDASKAKVFISENHEKWEKAMAVRFTEDGEQKWLCGGWCPE